MLRSDENLVQGVASDKGRHRKLGKRMTGLWRELRGAEVEFTPNMCKDIYQDKNAGGGMTYNRVGC